jgi:hypothetical protein
MGKIPKSREQANTQTELAASPVLQRLFNQETVIQGFPGSELMPLM